MRRVICTRPTGWILELDIQSYFDKIVRGILIEMVEKRVSDGSVLRLIQKWIKVGVIEDGTLLVSETGTGQGLGLLMGTSSIMHYLDFRSAKQCGLTGIPIRATLSLSQLDADLQSFGNIWNLSPTFRLPFAPSVVADPIGGSKRHTCVGTIAP